MALSTFKTFLMHKGASDSSYSKLIDIKEFPDMGGEPEMLETTTLSDRMKTYILGLQDTGSLAFTANYDKTDFGNLKDLENKKEHYAVWFGGTDGDDGTVTPDGSDGKFSFDGMLSVFVSGGSTNAVRDMSISIAPSTIISFA